MAVTRLRSLPTACLHLRPLSAQLPKPSPHLPPACLGANFASRPRRNVRYYSSEKAHSYTFEEMKALSENPQKGTLIIDVREPSELASTGRIPGARSMPLTSNPDAISLAPATFHQRFGFAKPTGPTRISTTPAERSIRDERDPAADGNEGHVSKVVFYCKAGVRSAAASELAMRKDGGWRGVQAGHFEGGWMEWAAKGGKVEEVE